MKRSKPEDCPSSCTLRRHDGENLGVADLHEGAEGALGDGLGAVLPAACVRSKGADAVKARPAFWPAPEKLKPATTKVKSTFAFSVSL